MNNTTLGARALVAAIALSTMTGCAAASYTDSSTGSSGTDEAVAATDANYTASQKNAIRSAQNYLSMTGFSKKGLIQQLSSDAGDGYPKADARFAVNHIKVNWKKQAVRSAKNYIDMTGFSRAGLIQQLSSSSGDKYTVKQAEYAADQVGLK